MLVQLVIKLLSVKINIILDKENWAEIQSELLDPLEDIVWEYL